MSVGVAAELTPAQAIRRAEGAAPKGVAGTFVMTVRSVEYYPTAPRLHSEPDHRNGRALSVFVSEAAHRQLEQRWGAGYADALKGRRIVVDGTARWQSVAEFVAGEAPRQYTMTIVELMDAAQLESPQASAATAPP